MKFKLLKETSDNNPLSSDILNLVEFIKSIGGTAKNISIDRDDKMPDSQPILTIENSDMMKLTWCDSSKFVNFIKKLSSNGLKILLNTFNSFLKIQKSIHSYIRRGLTRSIHERDKQIIKTKVNYIKQILRKNKLGED